MRRLAATVAILGFLALAAIGLASGVPTLHCALRALGGAAVLYVVTGMAGRLVIRIMVDALINGASTDSTSDRER